MAIQKITSNVLADGAVSAANLGDNSVTSAKLANNSVGIDQLNITDGTDGQLLKTNGSGTLSFVDAAGGKWDVLSKTTVSSSVSAITITNISSSYDQYKILYSDLGFASSPYNFEMFLSSDNGSSFVNLESPAGGLSAISIGNHNETNGANTTVRSINSGNGRIMLTDNMYRDIGAQEKTAGEINLSGFGNNNWTNFYSTHVFSHDNGAFNFRQTFGVVKKETTWNCIKFETGGGNFTSGVITLYGIKNT